MDAILILCALGALFFSGVCSASETSFFSLTAFERKKISRENKRANHLKYVLNHLSEVLVVILLFNLIFNIAFSFLIEKSLDKHFGHSAYQVTITVIVSTLLLVLFGEILPKSVAIGKRKILSVWLAGVWYILHKILLPVLPVLIGISDAMKKVLMHVFVPSYHVDKEHELTNLLALARRRGSLTPFEKSLIQNISDLHLLNAKDLMTPRVNVDMLDLSTDPDAIVKEIKKSRRAVYPLYRGSIDNIEGLLLAEKYFLEQGAMENFIIKPVFVPETVKFFNLMNQFQQRESPVALVVDEYGGFTGMVTFTDLMEELTSDIHQELKDPDSGVEYLGRGRYFIPGDMRLDDLGDLFRVELTSQSADTLNGAIQEISGSLTELGKIYHLGELCIKAEKVSRNRLILAKIWKERQA